MTTCVAALCCEGKAIVLAADKMIGLGYVESEPDISKIKAIHKNWRVMIAGNGIEPAFAIIDAAKSKLAPIPAPSLDVVITEMELAYQEKRLSDAAARYLRPIGWRLEDFKREGQDLLGDVAASGIRDAMHRFDYELSLLVAGFDEQDEGHVFSLTSDNRGVALRHDLGFHAVGSGETNAIFIMTYRKVGPKMMLREALYYTLEGKYYGELASGVGLRTDILVLRPNENDILIHEDNVEILMSKICEQVDPRDLRDQHVRLLNKIPELEGVPALPLPSVRTKADTAEEKARTKWSKEVRADRVV
jgi:20S proteasome alpha/beta subunit